MSFSSTLLGNLTKIRTGKLDANAANHGGEYPFFTCAREPLAINRYAYDCDAILVAGNGDLNVKHYKGKFEAYQRTYIIEVASESKLDSRYLYYFMFKYVEKLRELSIGGVIKYIKLGMLTGAKIPLPPLSEQKRIAAILDKSDDIRRKRQQAIKLTDESLRATFLDMFGDPVNNPKKWKLNKIDQVLAQIKAGWSAKGENRAREPQEWGVLKVSSITSGRFLPEECKVVESSRIKKAMVKPEKGDLLFSRANTRELVAATCLVERDYEKLFLPDKIWKMIPKENIACSEYLKFVLSNERFRDKIRKRATGTSGSMLNVSQPKVKNMSIPVPPIKLQKIFSNILWQSYKVRNKFEKNIGKSLYLFNALTQRAFRGEL